MKKMHLYSADMNSSQKESLFVQFPSLFKGTGIDKKNFKLTLMNNSIPKIIYHYTSLKTLQIILGRIDEEEEKCQNEASKTNCLVLRGTHIEFLNDFSEFKLAARLMADLIKEYEDTLFRESR